MSVNGQDAHILVGEMLVNIWSDGFIMCKRYRRLNNIFPYLYALNYGYPEGFEIVVQEEGREREIKINPVPRLVITAYRDSLVASGTIRREDLVMELKDEVAALLTIRTFAYYDDNKGFNRFIDSSFQVIHDLDIQHLVIDLRGNDGGDPFCSTHLLAYLQKKPVIYFREPYGRYARLNKPLPMAENRFSGKQYYLIDGMCFSTTGHLASLLKYYGLGTFIGEETGATYTCNDASHDTKLKHTGYRLQSARRSFATAVTGFPLGQGILPDYPVRQSIHELIRNHDTVLDYTLELIKQNNVI
jgi:C-terminal processing protease CtpA/Prc